MRPAKCNRHQFNENMATILVSRKVTNVSQKLRIEIFMSTNGEDQGNAGYHHLVNNEDTPKEAVINAIEALRHAFHRGHNRLWVHQDNKEK